MTTPRAVPAVLHSAARLRGGQPLLTHYRADRGERTELSHTSFANWVDKTANLLADLGLDAEADVALCVLAEHPAHWMGLVWPFALWQVGGGADVRERAAAADADLAVLGPVAPAPVGAVTLACSLHPWGLALPGLPPGVTDFSSEALAQPDAHASSPARPDATAWRDRHGVLTHQDLARVPGEERRVAIRPTDARSAVLALVGALHGGGSVVVLEGVDAAGAARLAASEHAVLIEAAEEAGPPAHVHDRQDDR